MKNLLRYGYPLLMLVGVNGTVIALAGSGAPKIALIGVVLAAIALSFAAERVIPYERAWNHSHDDAGRDVAHVLVNESLMLASLAVIPLVAAVRGPGSWWPHALPFWAQVLLAVLVADLGITAVHMASHRYGWLWRLHAVHHSVTRCYGLNGLMKHPLHQTLETLGGVAPLLVLGMPVPVASALAAMVAVQLLMQHSNADYRVGPLRSVLALNEGHRFHHQREAGAGDVDFGLFTLLWDHLFGTYVLDRRRRFTSADLGMAAKPDYPAGYRQQLVAPFTAAGGCGEMGPLPRRTVRDRLLSVGRRTG
ncbi:MULTISPECIES: sterol desaturase family protein [Tsukamurella]|uniref:Sterol desaturase family protein n=2 Tax=Tsukamurella TaxID=2060 RepID=A0A5C5S599_9ACTN|nr:MULTISPECIES: sterol desaturase family protein [Tsukamurella]NMD55008.1 sterol desaturase family protein [Tsukamurella columbiensis]TWS30042.1 sterol desaturase family protein [Tsukamurella conjunctivitidis]